MPVRAADSLTTKDPSAAEPARRPLSPIWSADVPYTDALDEKPLAEGMDLATTRAWMIYSALGIRRLRIE